MARLFLFDGMALVYQSPLLDIAAPDSHVPGVPDSGHVDFLRTICSSARGRASFDIVFVHGLDGDWRKTWRAKGLPDEDPDGWPGWLGEDGEARRIVCNVHSLNYPACSTNWKGASLPLFDQAGQLLEALDLSLARDTRLFFICHSLGGLLVKHMLGQARHKGNSKARIPERTAGILFLGTPHQGSGVANIVGRLLPKLLSRRTVTLEELERQNPGLREINEVFRHQARERNWLVHQFAEGRDTFKFRVVDEYSANSGVGDFVVTGEDHISLPKPANRRCMVYLRALRMLEDLSARMEKPVDIRSLIREVLKEKGVIAN